MDAETRKLLVKMCSKQTVATSSEILGRSNFKGGTVGTIMEHSMREG